MTRTTRHALPRRLWLAALLPLAGCSGQSVECLTLDLESGLAWRMRGTSWRLLGGAEPLACAPPALPPAEDGPPVLPPPAPMRT
ncbi:hypothetical protein [Falsiroseomonas tokyonensis]|uniref:hypothetical protein n=1 Tax=Falsiroseomonas tokyonensis TaxID=430521 RepID=UPI001C204165|nr:hypothetical protein [Falsiroseomonas tokyonensis]